MMQMRCASKLHGIIVTGGIVEVKCDSRFCRPDRDTIVLHHFDATTGRLIETLRFKNPSKERSNNGSRRHPATIRPS